MNIKTPACGTFFFFIAFRVIPVPIPNRTISDNPILPTTTPSPAEICILVWTMIWKHENMQFPNVLYNPPTTNATTLDIPILVWTQI